MTTDADKLFTYQINEQGCLEADIINMESTITMKYGWVDMIQISVSFRWRTDDISTVQRREATLAMPATEC